MATAATGVRSGERGGAGIGSDCGCGGGVVVRGQERGAGFETHPELERWGRRGDLAARGGQLGEGALTVVEAWLIGFVQVERLHRRDEEQERRDDEQELQEPRPKDRTHGWPLFIRETGSLCNFRRRGSARQGAAGPSKSSGRTRDIMLTRRGDSGSTKGGGEYGDRDLEPRGSIRRPRLRVGVGAALPIGGRRPGGAPRRWLRHRAPPRRHPFRS